MEVTKDPTSSEKRSKYEKMIKKCQMKIVEKKTVVINLEKLTRFKFKIKVA